MSKLMSSFNYFHPFIKAGALSLALLTAVEAPQAAGDEKFFVKLSPAEASKIPATGRVDVVTAEGQMDQAQFQLLGKPNKNFDSIIAGVYGKIAKVKAAETLEAKMAEAAGFVHYASSMGDILAEFKTYFGRSRLIGNGGLGALATPAKAFFDKSGVDARAWPAEDVIVGAHYAETVFGAVTAGKTPEGLVKEFEKDQYKTQEKFKRWVDTLKFDNNLLLYTCTGRLGVCTQAVNVLNK